MAKRKTAKNKKGDRNQSAHAQAQLTGLADHLSPTARRVIPLFPAVGDGVIGPEASKVPYP